jgi:hypothetical protein
MNIEQDIHNTWHYGETPHEFEHIPPRWRHLARQAKREKNKDWFKKEKHEKQTEAEIERTS